MTKTVSASEARLSRTDTGLLGLLLLVGVMGGLWIYRSVRSQEIFETIEVEDI
jgi:hypothetical protein